MSENDDIKESDSEKPGSNKSDSDKSEPDLSEKDNDPSRGKRGPRGRKGPIGPKIESLIVTLKPGHTEYIIKNEADVVICTGETCFPQLLLPKIFSTQTFDNEYLTVHKTHCRVKIINRSMSRLTLKTHPEDKFDNDKKKITVKIDKYIIIYGVGNCWYLSK